jgi:hypothetical protein
MSPILVRHFDGAVCGPAGLCVLNPVIQEVGKLPAGTSVPNTVITEQAVRALHETVGPVGWLVQAPAALTPVQINAARQSAVALGTSIQTKSGELGLGQISNGATVGGILIALGAPSAVSRQPLE